MDNSNSPHQGSSLYRLILETRQLFHVLAQASAEMNRKSGITASMRAVMETLYPDVEMTVPDIARQKNVTRQHIQNIFNELSRTDLAEAIENPAHKRSSLVRLTPSGVTEFKAILSREKELFVAMTREFDEKQLAQSADGLKSVRDYFSSDAWRSTLKSITDK